MKQIVRLRPWQKQALDAFHAHSGADFLAVATPGAGKTTFAVVAALHALRGGARRVVVVAPTAHLKAQWANAAARFGMQLDPAWSAGSRLAADMHGIVTTYQQVSSNADALRGLSDGSFTVLDEIHHAGEERAWGDAVRIAFEPATRRLSLSGTPFRSDTRSIPFVQYRLDEATADYEYGYGEALKDGGVVRPAYFPRINGFMEWVAPDGSLNAASFEDALDRTHSSQRLRTALSAQGDWLPDVLAQAHERLVALRERKPDAGGLVIAADQEHARAIADLMRWRLRLNPTVVLSDDPTASDRIKHFAEGTQPWIVAVRMVSEGVDIPRLTIGVYATTTTTELFFRQAVGRLVRWTPGIRRQKAYLFIPDDPRLRTWAAQITDIRRHSLRTRADDMGGEAETDGRPVDDGSALDPATQEPDEQLSLFTALSATVADGPHTIVGVFDEDYDDFGSDHPGTESELDGLDLPGLEIDIAALAPPLAFRGEQAGLSRFEQKEALRATNAELARELVRFTALTHAQVNAQLNRSVGLRSIDEATVEQLGRRAMEAQRWRSRL